MWIDNGDGTHTAESGDTLWDLYGPEWEDKSGFEGDPITLQPGDVVGIERVENSGRNEEGVELNFFSPSEAISGSVKEGFLPETTGVDKTGLFNGLISIGSGVAGVKSGVAFIASTSTALATGGAILIVGGVFFVCWGVAEIGSALKGESIPTSTDIMTEAASLGEADTSFDK